MSHNYYNEILSYFVGTYCVYPDCCIDDYDYNKRSKNKFLKLIGKASCIEKNTGFILVLAVQKKLLLNKLSSNK